MPVRLPTTRTRPRTPAAHASVRARARDVVTEPNHRDDVALNATSAAHTHAITTTTTRALATMTTTARISGTKLADGVSLVRGQLVADGFDVVTRASLRRSGALLLVKAAQKLWTTDGVDKLAPDQRAGLSASLGPLLSTASAGRPSLHDVARRAGAFAILERVLVAMRAPKEKRPARLLRDALARAADVETNPGLREHMRARLAAPTTSSPVYMAPAPATALWAAALRSTFDANRARGASEALALAVGVLASSCPYSDVADVILRDFAKRNGFGVGLSWPVVEKALSAGAAGSPPMREMLERGMRRSFLEVNPARTTARFRRFVGAAVEVLRRSDTKIAKVTLEAIESGRVKVDMLDDLTRADYLRVRRDYLKQGNVLPLNDDALDRTHSRAWRAITQDLNGYMWDDRVYVTAGQSARQLASTLVHEVNHVLNQSEEHYRGDRQILTEEYRAFYCEAVFAGQKMTKAKCREIKERVIRDYGLKDVAVDDVSDLPPGFIE